MVYTISHSLGCKDQSITTEPGNFALYHAYDAYQPYHILKTVSTLSGITIHSLFPSAEGKPVRIIYENPIFWTEERLQEKSYLFTMLQQRLASLTSKTPKEEYCTYMV